MNKISLKKILIFWQEIIFLIFISVYLIGFIIENSRFFEQSFNLFIFSLFLTIFFCLIGQFYWKNKKIAIVLAFIFGICSGYMILAILSDLMNLKASNYQVVMGLIFGLLLFIGLVFAAITMPSKYNNF